MTKKDINLVMDDINRSLKERFGTVPIAWMPMLDIYKDYLYLYDELIEEFKEGNRKGNVLKSIKDTVGIILAISQKLGVSSPYDNNRLKTKEKEEEEPDYLSTLDS